MAVSARRWLAPVAVAGVALIAGACSSTPAAVPTTTTTTAPTPTTAGPPLPAGTPPTAQVLLPKIEAAIANSAGVHVVGLNRTLKTGVTQNYVDDLGVHTGRQQLTSAGARLEVRLTVRRAYLIGNSGGLQQFFGAPPDIAANAVSSWYYVNAGDNEYTQFKSQATLVAIANAYLPQKQAVLVDKGVYQGQQVYVLTWASTPDKSATKITLYVKSVGAPLLIAEFGNSPTNYEQASFTNWGESVNVQIPSPSRPLSDFFNAPGAG